LTTITVLKYAEMISGIDD